MPGRGLESQKVVESPLVGKSYGQGNSFGQESCSDREVVPFGRSESRSVVRKVVRSFGKLYGCSESRWAVQKVVWSFGLFGKLFGCLESHSVVQQISE